MQHYRRLLILTCLLVNECAYASSFFIDALSWRATETNNWVYNNSLTVPVQTLDYRSIEFNYNTGLRLGASYEKDKNDILFSYTHFYTSTHDAASGHLQPSFIGSVTAKPSSAYLYNTGQVSQSINYNIIDVDSGRSFNPIQSLILHPIIGIMGGWIYQTIHARYQGSTSTNEQIINNFKGIGPKAGIETEIKIFNYHKIQPQLFASFAASYQIGYWKISDTTKVVNGNSVNVIGSNPRMGAITLQGALGVRLDYKKLRIKFAYEINDWRDQAQFFDNDTGAHNNDLIIQGLTAGINYQFG